jgi:hypothetical protein
MLQENPANWSQGFWGSEHPDTAALRVQKDYVDTMIALKRENMDRVYVYLTGLLDKAKEELHHARTAGNELRRLALRQNVDEIVAYLKGQALDVAPPPVQEPVGYVLDEVPAFFGRVKCVIDQWYDSHLMSVYDEVVILMSLRNKASVQSPA